MFLKKIVKVSIHCFSFIFKNPLNVFYLHPDEKFIKKNVYGLRTAI